MKWCPYPRQGRQLTHRIRRMQLRESASRPTETMLRDTCRISRPRRACHAASTPHAAYPRTR
ncbi:hypothetical protein DF19_22920 [Streptomyces olindensis]|nr:hypothetical protein DF19_22920 [Streptomyces olindensis]